MRQILLYCPAMDTGRTTGFHERFRRQLRADILDAAYRITCERGWSAVTNTSLAQAVGISRQTIYKEFGTRLQVGEAMMLREAERLITDLIEVLEPCEDVTSLIGTTVDYAFTRTASNPLLITILRAPQRSDTLLSLVTLHTAPLIAIATRALAAEIERRKPDLDPEDVESTVDALIRLVVSHLLQPSGDQGRTIARLTRLACRNL